MRVTRSARRSARTPRATSRSLTIKRSPWRRIRTSYTDRPRHDRLRDATRRSSKSPPNARTNDPRAHPPRHDRAQRKSTESLRADCAKTSRSPPASCVSPGNVRTSPTRSLCASCSHDSHEHHQHSGHPPRPSLDADCRNRSLAGPLASELALGERSLGAARLALCQERSSTWTMPSAWFRPEADVLCQPWAQIFF